MNSSIANLSRTRALGIVCVIAVVILYAGFTLVSKLGFASSLKLLDVAALRFAIAGLVMLPVLLFYGFKGIRLLDAFGLAIFGGVGFALFAYTGFLLAPASHGGVLLHGTLPLFSFVLARFIYHRQASVGRMIGLGAITLGIIAMIWDSLYASTPSQLFGDSSLLLASVLWSAYGLLAQKVGLKPAHSASIVAVFSMCLFMPVYLLLPGQGFLTVGWQEIILQGLFQGVLIGAISIFLYTKAVSLLGAIETSLFTAAIPCVTTISAVFLLGEIPSTFAIAGLFMVTIGMFVSIKH